jgi:hypothetical protein
MAIKAPFLPYDKLRQIADEFLAQYHPDGSIPVPIELIVDNDFDLDIVPVPGLEDSIGIASYPTSDLKEIHVDDWVYKRQPQRYRFCLAHELSHLLIHQDIFSQLSFNSMEGWRVAVCSIPEEEYSWIEHQAYNLAGLILVPAEPLSSKFKEVADRAEGAGITLVGASIAVRRTIESHIAKYFDVSLQVVQKRTKADGLWP